MLSSDEQYEPLHMVESKRVELEEQTQASYDKQIEQIVKQAGSISQYMFSFAEGIHKKIVQFAQDSIPVTLQVEIPNPTVSPMCSKTVGHNYQTSKIFKCFDCSEADNSIQCRKCFSQADHKGHNYLQTPTGQGCCDCGNEEMFNPKGFCPTHSKKIEKVEIPQAIRSQFLKEGTFLIYMMFWLDQRTEVFNIREEFVKRQNNQYMRKFLLLSAKNYEVKMLIVQILQQRLAKFFPSLPHLNYNQLTITQMIFRWERRQFMQDFCRLTYQLFPIQQIRVEILREYFQKSSEDQNFNFEHPLRLVNFQFMTCMKTINSMIRNNELSPLRLPSPAKIESGIEPNKLLLRLVDDFQYPSQMKGAKQFHALICERSNIAETLLRYRQIANDKINKKQFDDYWVKTLKHFLKSISDNKGLVQKVLKQLWEYILKVQKMSHSLIHQRVFAMFLVSYLEGDLLSLKQPSTLARVRNVLNLTQSNSEKLIEGLMVYHLSSCLISWATPEENIRNDYVYQFFNTTNPWYHLPHMLDFNYQKILLLLSQNSVSYVRVQNEIIKLIDCTYFLQNLRKQVIITSLLSFVNSVMTIDTNELIVQAMVGKLDFKRAQLFYGRFVNTFREIKAAQVKRKVIKVLYHEEAFEQFVMKQCYFEKGFLKTKGTFQPFSSLEYHSFFQMFNIEILGLPDSQHKVSQLAQYADVVFHDEKLIVFYMQFCKKLYTEFQEKKAKFSKTSYSPYLGIQLLLVYEATKFEQLGRFIQNQLTKMAAQTDYLVLKRVIKSVMSIQDIFEEEDDKKASGRKAKLMQKRKEKQQKLKQMRQKMLKELNLNELSTQTQDNICIFCRESKEEDVRMVCSLTLDNIVNKSVLRLDFPRLSFKTCGHKIHRQCFYNNLYDIEKVCFLCRRPGNILVPDFSKQMTLQQCNDFLESLVPTLLEYYQNASEQINKLVPSGEEDGTIRAIVNCAISELMVFGSHEDLFARQHIIPIFQQLLYLLAKIPTERVIRSFELDKLLIPSNHQLYSQNRSFLKDRLFNIKQGQILPPIQNKLNKIYCIVTGTQTVSQIKCLKMVDPEEYLFELPQSLQELHKQMGQCPSCKTVTQHIMLCLICGWKICTRQKNNLISHIQSHNGSIFIKCDSGGLVFFFKEHFFMRKSLYINYMGESFVGSTVKGVDPSPYKLNVEKYQMIRRSIAQNELNSLALKELT